MDDRVKRHYRFPLARPWSIVLVLIVAGIAVIPLDLPLTRFFLADKMPGEWRRLIHRSEFFGHAYGVLGIALTIYLIDVARRRQIARLLACAFGAGLFCDLIKLLVHRTRPCDFDSQASIGDSFRGLSFRNADTWADFFASANHSLPSAHTATAVALAMALSRLYPRGRRWFGTLALLVATSRVDGGAHFASDTFWGAAVGFLVAHIVLNQTRVGRWFDRHEATARQPLVFGDSRDAPLHRRAA